MRSTVISRRTLPRLTGVLLLTLALAVVVGVTLGLFGGGGSILTVPLLIYVAGLGTKEAIATTRPRPSNTGPPELPPLSARSVCRKRKPSTRK